MVSKTYNTLSLLDTRNELTPFSVGFDRQFNRLHEYYQRQQQQSAGFPPYNIQKTKDFEYEIELALAGFGKDDIEIEVADGVLTVRSVKEKDDDEVNDDYTLFRGISYRKFNRKFTLADDVVVNDAKLENGLLTIELEQIVPEEKKPRLIKIK